MKYRHISFKYMLLHFRFIQKYFPHLYNFYPIFSNFQSNMVLQYIDSPLSFHSTHASDQSEASKSIQKYKRISSEKRKLLLEKIFFENKKIKKVFLFNIFFHIFNVFEKIGCQRIESQLLLCQNHPTSL